MSQHTPGPWEWAKDRDDEFTFLKGDGRYVLSPECVSTGYTWVSVSDADASLIAAAPELLKALKACRSCIDELMGDSDPLEETSALIACQLASAAIAKAEAQQ